MDISSVKELKGRRKLRTGTYFTGVSYSLKLAGINILFGQCDNWFYLQLKKRNNFKDTLTFSPTSSFKVRLDNIESANTTIVKLLWAKKLIKVR